MSFKKKLIAVLLFVQMMMASMSFAFAEAYLLEEKTEKTLLKGVTYTRMERLYESGWQDIHIIKADLSQEHLAFDILKSAEGLSFLEDTYTAAVANDAVAAINADFFAAKKGESKKGSAVGVLISDGEVLTTPASDEKMNALYMTEDKAFHFNEFSYDITITAPNGNSDKIRHINKYDDLNGIVLYNKNWDKMSLGATFGVIEVVVDENNIVTEKRRWQDPTEIPENGYILSSDLDVHTFLDDNFNVGDEVKIEITTTPDYKLIEKAVSGGGMLVVDGEPQTMFSHNIGGKNPRTAVGIDKSGKIMYMVVVDGRRELAKGMTQAELALLMKEIGCYNALNFDGGGSSLMAIKDGGEHTLANTVSDGYKRPVTNSVGILSSAEIGDIVRIEAKTEDDSMFANTSRVISVSAYDEYDHEIILDIGKVEWELYGVEGNVDAGLFVAESAGDAKIKAKYQGFESELEITVMDKPYYLEFDEPKMSLKSGESKILSITGRDENGFPAKIYAKDTDISVSEDVGSVVGNLLTVKSKSGIISAGFGQAKAYASLSVNGGDAPALPENIGKEDEQNYKKDVSDTGFVFNVFGNTRTPKTLFDLFLMNTAKSSVSIDSDYRFFVGTGIDYDILTDVSGRVFAHEYSTFDHKGSRFICIDNTSGTIYGENTTQWKNLKRDIEGAENNLFVFLNKITVSSNEIEYKNFTELMTKAVLRGVNVYVIGGGWKNETSIKSGVRYITTAGVFPSIGLNPPANNISYVKYLRVAVDGEDVSYSFENILNDLDK